MFLIPQALIVIINNTRCGNKRLTTGTQSPNNRGKRYATIQVDTQQSRMDNITCHSAA